MGKRRRRARQPTMWVANADLPRSAGHPFYARLNHVLDEAGFDAFVEEQCAKFYADGVSRPSLPPGRYFRMLLLGYFEGLESERAMAWRAADSLSLRPFQDIACTRRRPITRPVSRTRRRIDVETHEAVFTGAAARGRHRLAEGEDGRHRRADAGSERGAAEHRPPGHVARATTRSCSVLPRPPAFGRRPRPSCRASTGSGGRRAPTRIASTRRDPDAKITKMKDGRTHPPPRPSTRSTWRRARSAASPCRMPAPATRRRWSKRWSRRRTRSKRCCRPVEALPGWSRTRGTTATRRWSRWPNGDCAATCRSRTASRNSRRKCRWHDFRDGTREPSSRRGELRMERKAA